MESTRDTLLDSLAAQARAHPPLPVEEVGELLRAARERPREAAAEMLVRHHLSLVLDSALARRAPGLELADLYQEGSVAVVTAVDEYVRRGGDPEGLRPYVQRIVDLHLDAAVERDTTQRETDEAFVRDSRLVESAEVALRSRLGRPATTLELAAALQWPAERVGLISAMLADARRLHDESLLPFLDDLAADADADADGADGDGHGGPSATSRP